MNSGRRARTDAVKLPPFAHHRAECVEDAVAVLAEHADAARVLAGGQSLLPLMALRMSDPEVLVDITAAPDLHGHEVGDGVVTVPAAVTMRTLETDPAVLLALEGTLVLASASGTRRIPAGELVTGAYTRTRRAATGGPNPPTTRSCPTGRLARTGELPDVRRAPRRNRSV
jgi:CO/xanthine dehydrogenase FAD-binding subunit